MKLLKTLAGATLIYLLFFSTGTQITSCNKTETIYDTVIIRDTIVDSLACSCYDLKDGLVAYYNFKGGTLKDSSGYNNHITFSNATATTDRLGKANSAYLFNGTSSYMRVPNSASINPSTAITLMAIVKANGYYMGSCHVNSIFTKSGGSDYTDGFYNLRFSDYPVDCADPIHTDKEFFTGAYGDSKTGNTYAGSGTGADTVFTKLNTWYQVVFTYESGVAKLYVDGVLRHTYQKSVVFTDNGQDLYIGKTSYSQYPYWLNGVIDEIRIYNKALCAGAVKQLYNQAD